MNRMEKILSNPKRQIEDMNKLFLLINAFWWLNFAQRVESIIDKVYLDKEGNFKVKWKKKHWWKLNLEKIFDKFNKN
jgi:hypothetical protein